MRKNEQKTMPQRIARDAQIMTSAAARDAQLATPGHQARPLVLVSVKESGTALHHSLPLLEIRTKAEGTGLIEGYASVFGGIDSYSDSVQPGAFTQSLIDHKTAGTKPVMLWAHAGAKPVGQWIDLAEDGRGLKVTGLLNLQTISGRDAYEHLRAGDITGLSIGYRVRPGGSETKGGVTYLKHLDLHEISIVAVPADAAARIISVKEAIHKPETLRDFEKALQTLGFSRKEATHIAAKGFGEVPEDPKVFSQTEATAIKAALASLSKTFI